jgi:hypothetical protein
LSAFEEAIRAKGEAAMFIFVSIRSGGPEQPKHRERQNPLQPRGRNIFFIGSPECVRPDASGKFFAHFQFRWRTQF